jgi:hypothetical protein
MKDFLDQKRLQDAELVNFFPTDDEVIQAIREVPPHYSANYVVDLTPQSVYTGVSIFNAAGQGVGIAPTLNASGYTINANLGTTIGQSLDMLQADAFTNIFLAGLAINTGELKVQIQVSDSDVSGNYTDPTSGYPANQFPLYGGPTQFANLGGVFSGGMVYFGSGCGGGDLYGQASGHSAESGFMVCQPFIRNARYMRLNVLSGGIVATYTSGYQGSLIAGAIGQLKTTGGSGGAGFVYSPGSGTVNV